VFEKFRKVAAENGVLSWNGANKNVLTSYAAWLDGEGYAYATEYLELTTLKQAIKWVSEEGHLPTTALIRYPLDKPSGTDTYCYRPAEVAAIVDLCRKQPELAWLADIVTALACTALRISESLLRCVGMTSTTVFRCFESSTSVIVAIGPGVRRGERRPAAAVPLPFTRTSSPS
jgi:hypothetical protein